ncbi:MAG: RimK/LysX family protein, partial [archaeon]
AAKAGIGPIISSVKIKNSSAPNGYTRRAIAEAVIIVKGKRIHTGVNIEDREGMPYSVLIGRDVIHDNFLIDVAKSHTSFRVRDSKNAKERTRLQQS